MVKELSTEEGSAGLDMILWSLMLLIFIALPLIGGIFELYTYTLHGVKWSAATENVLDQVEWQLQTEALSECGRELFLEKTRQQFQLNFDELAAENQGTDWRLEELLFREQSPPVLEVDVTVVYPPVTLVGVLIGKEGGLAIHLFRQREFPIDR